MRISRATNGGSSCFTYDEKDQPLFMKTFRLMNLFKNLKLGVMEVSAVTGMENFTLFVWYKPESSAQLQS